jgi:TetR/AcrR family transcriptional repressor of nem operon
MRYGPGHKEETRERILDRAAALFRREGYPGVGIDRIMAAADLTRGAFYAHFASKAELFAAVLRRESDFVRRLRASRDARAVVEGYLDPRHREQVGHGCPLASLTSELPRRDAAARAAFTEQVESLVAELEAHVAAGEGDARERALLTVAICVGGIGLARGVDDEALACEILRVCRDRAVEALGAAAASLVASEADGAPEPGATSTADAGARTDRAGARTDRAGARTDRADARTDRSDD